MKSVAHKSVARRMAEARGFDPVAHALHRRRIAREQIDSARASDSGAFRDFAKHVALATTGPVLRYSQRLRLIDLAQRGGIARFDANLIIAAIEHRNSQPRLRSDQSTSEPLMTCRTFLLAAAACVQMVIVITAWLTLLR